MFGSDTGIRTRVLAVRGLRPGPLDDIAVKKVYRASLIAATRLVYWPILVNASSASVVSLML
jgi:hypothetical protein